MFNKIKEKAKKVVKKVVSTVKSIGSALTKPISTSGQTASVFNAVTLPGAKLNKPYVEPQATGKSPGGTTYYDNYSPAGKTIAGQMDSGNNQSEKVSFKSLMTPATGANQSAPSLMTRNPSGTSYSSGSSLSKSYGSESFVPPVLAQTSNFSSGSEPISQNISSASLGSPSINVAPSNSSNTYSNTTANNVGLGADPASNIIPTSTVTGLQPQEKEAPQEKTTIQSLLDNLRAPVDESKLLRKAQTESGIQEAQQRVLNTQNQINAITAKNTTDLLSQRKAISESGGTMAGFGSIESRINRDAAIQLLPLQAQLSADQGNLEMAQSNLDSLFKMYSNEAKESRAFYNKQVESVYEYSTAKEKREYDEQKSQKEFQEKVLGDDIKFHRDMIGQAVEDKNYRLFNALKAIQPPINFTSPTQGKDRAQYNADITEAVNSYGTREQASPSPRGALASLPVSIQNRVISLADNLKSTDIVKKYNSTADSINVVNGINPSSKNPADHQQIVYAFAKALDPDSAVREGEYATIKKYAQGAISRYGKEITNAINGTGFLSESAIKNIQSTMNQTFNSRKPLYENQVKETSRVINNIAGSDVASEIMIDYSGGSTSQGQSTVAPEVQSLRAKYNY